MTVEVKFHEDAVAEYEAAFEWYYLWSEFVASRFAEELNRAIAVISDAPKR
jgi:plasmid stabilization system protein ParE